MKHFLLLTCLFFSLSASAQRVCASADHFAGQMAENPEMRQARDSFEQQQRRKPPVAGKVNNVVTIPVVFHIVHDGDAVGSDENLSTALIQAQLDQMNADFSLTNSDVNLIPAFFQPLAADCQIQFCLAQRTPACQATTGINRINGGQADWTRTQIENSLKPSTIWDRNQYLNFWTVRFAASEGGLLGYAQFPGGPANRDGVVCVYTSVGSLANPNPGSANYGMGRTATHEIGHWLNLIHIWGDANCGSDLVSDTPVHETDNGGCPVHPKLNNCAGGPYTEMFMNYMDYVQDNCMHMFSEGQSDRMNALFDEDTGLRGSLAVSEGCIAPGVCYCAAGANGQQYEKIGNVTFGGINKSSIGTAGYQNFTANTGTVTKGSAYPFTATITGGYSSDQILVWIDYNQDGDFTDAGENVFTSPNGLGPHSTNITIPTNAATGTTRMRVRLHDTSDGPNATSCGSSSWGQVEDYTLMIEAALPVELTSFEARAIQKRQVNLNWTVGAASRFEGFGVEMAVNESLDFQKVGYVANRNSSNYAFEVKNLNPGTYYFRLRHIDTDGQESFSPVRMVELKNVELISSLTPNPVNTALTCQLNLTEETSATISIISQTGQVIKTVYGNQSIISIDVKDLTPGMYQMMVQSEYRTAVRRFVKM